MDKEKETQKIEEEQKVEPSEVPAIVEEPAAEEIVKAEEIPIAEEEVTEKEVAVIKKITEFDISKWTPKTELGRKIKAGEITDIDQVLDSGVRVLEPEIIDALLQNAEIDLLLIGQSKGKFGGGQRRVFKQTQKKTNEGNKPSFATCAMIGNRNGYIGMGYGKSRETVPAREKAFRQAKLNVIKIRRGCGSWECGCGKAHSIPYKVSGKVGSVIVTLMPAPNGTGLCVEKECAKILALAGIKDVWSKTSGQTTTKLNHVKACFEALKSLTATKVRAQDIKNTGIVEGKVVE
jgi:small subunit ribosomal protein S5